MNRSRISWLVNADGTPGYTWSPTTGCGPGLPCYERCWARAYHVRYRKGDFSVKLHPEKLDEAVRLRKPSVIGVSLMGDLAHEDVPADFAREVFNIAWAAADSNGHTLIFLTKRPKRMAYLLAEWRRGNMQIAGQPFGWWLGVSVEDRPSLARVDVLRDTPAAHRWISLEPQVADVGKLDLRGISLVVQGAESGPRRRPFSVEWARDVKRQCEAAGVAWYFKQTQIRQCEAGMSCSHDSAGGCPVVDRCVGDVVELPLLDGHRCSHACLPWAQGEGGG